MRSLTHQQSTHSWWVTALNTLIYSLLILGLCLTHPTNNVYTSTQTVSMIFLTLKTQRFFLLFFLAILTFSGSFLGNSLLGKTEITTIAQTTEDLKSQAEQLERQGIEYFQAGKIDATIQAWEQALAIYQQLKDTKNEARLLENFGTLYFELKDYNKAIEALKSSLVIVQKLNNKEAQESLLFKLARASRALKQYNQASNYYQQALALARELGNTEGQIDALGNLGDIYYKLENYTLAIAAYTEVWKLAQKLNNPSIEVVALKSLADTYYFLGNCEYALAFYDFGLDIAQKLGDKEEQLGLLQNRGNAAYCLGKSEVALDSYQKGLTLAKELNDESAQGQLIGNIGLVYVHLGRYSEAISYLQEDLKIARKNGERLIEGQALGSLGDAYYFQGDYNNALDFYQQSLAIAQEVSYNRGIALMLTNIGATQLKLNQLPEAEKQLRNSLEIYAEVRSKVGDQDENKLSTFERETRTYRVLQEVLIEQNKIEDALVIAESGRARIFAELLAQKSGNYTEVTNPNLKDIQSVATKENATLVEYSVIYEKDETKNKEAKLYIWVVQPNGKTTFKQVELASANIILKDLVNNSRQSIGVGGRGLAVVAKEPGNQQKSLQKLHQILIEPIADVLPSDPNAHVIFIPNEELFLVPFPALQANDNSYLIQKHTILTAPSIQVLQLITQKSNNRGTSTQALIVGNPTMPSVKAAPGEKPEQLTSLPGAEQEATTVAQLLKTQAITGSQASKSNIIPKMQQSEIIHLATHGLLDVDSNGTLNTNYAGFKVGGAIALAPQGTDSGLLTVEEILDLKLDADLVVLSACDTARGKIVGDGVIGLSRSFMAAGAESVVVSLWSVPDAPTAQLMTAFYQQLQQNPDKAQALRQAMLTTMKQHPNPRDWAAFTLMGEAK